MVDNSEIEVIDKSEIPGPYANRIRRYHKCDIVYDAINMLKELNNPQKAVRFSTDHISAFTHSNIHSIVRQAGERNGIEVGLRKATDYTYIYLKES